MKYSKLNEEERKVWSNALCAARNNPKRNSQLDIALRAYSEAFQKLEQMKRDIYDKYLKENK